MVLTFFSHHFIIFLSSERKNSLLAGRSLCNFHLFMYSLIHLFIPFFSAYNSLIFMLMATMGGGRVLMTYLQWSSCDGLAHPKIAVKSNEIIEGWR